MESISTIKINKLVNKLGQQKGESMADWVKRLDKRSKRNKRIKLMKKLYMDLNFKKKIKVKKHSLKKIKNHLPQN